eukprot:4496669-Alexandrium_andersonii.AAC.1
MEPWGFSSLVASMRGPNSRTSAARCPLTTMSGISTSTLEILWSGHNGAARGSSKPVLCLPPSAGPRGMN